MHACLGKENNFDEPVVEKEPIEVCPRTSLRFGRVVHNVTNGCMQCCWHRGLVWLVCGRLIRRAWSVYSVNCFWVTHIEEHMSIFRSSFVEQRSWVENAQSGVFDNNLFVRSVAGSSMRR